MKSLPTFLLAIVLAVPAFAEGASFAAPFTSQAVLQRDCTLPIWGSAKPGASRAARP